MNEDMGGAQSMVCGLGWLSTSSTVKGFDLKAHALSMRCDPWLSPLEGETQGSMMITVCIQFLLLYLTVYDIM